MIQRLLFIATSQPRPTDCEACGAAWDDMVEARLKLQGFNPDAPCAPEKQR